jgi:membrane-bound inhibitor of C-type lysozyme
MFGTALPRIARFIASSFLLASSSLSLAQEPANNAGQAAPSAQPKSHRMPVARKFSYACDGGLTVNVTLREQNARVTFKDKSYSMKQVRSGSGARYADGTTVWWSKGYEGFLQDETDPNHPVKLAENCKQTSPQPKAP